MLHPVPSSHPCPNPIAQGRTCAGDYTSCGGTSPCPSSPSSPGEASQLQEKLPSSRTGSPAPGEVPQLQEAQGKLSVHGCGVWIRPWEEGRAQVSAPRLLLILAFGFKGGKGRSHEDQDRETGDGNDVTLQLSALGQISPFGKTERERERDPGKTLSSEMLGESGSGTKRRTPWWDAPAAARGWMSPSAVFCMDPVTLLQSAELPATQHIFEQNYVSCICFAPCQNFFFPPNGALALGKGAGVGAGERRAAADLPGSGDGDDTRQPVVSRLPAQIHLRLAANKSLHLTLVHCLPGDKSVGLGAWHRASLGTAEGPRTGSLEPTPPWRMQCSSRGGLGVGKLKNYINDATNSSNRR